MSKIKASLLLHCNGNNKFILPKKYIPNDIIGIYYKNEEIKNYTVYDNIIKLTTNKTIEKITIYIERNNEQNN